MIAFMTRAIGLLFEWTDATIYEPEDVVSGMIRAGWTFDARRRV